MRDPGPAGTQGAGDPDLNTVHSSGPTGSSGPASPADPTRPDSPGDTATAATDSWDSLHIPVLAERVADLLAPALTGRAVFVDATLGMGGHTLMLLRAHPQLTAIGIDRDPQALRIAGQRLAAAGVADRAVLVHAVYDRIGEVMAREVPSGVVQAVLFDLGVSSLQLDEVDRGFAYSVDAPLDMRMDPTTGPSAADVLNTYPPGALVRVLREYGEEKFATRIVSAVVRQRAQQPFTTSGPLVELIREAIPAAARRTGGHPAKRTFQALRIEVNDELGALRRAVPAAVDGLAVDGRIVVLSYHSLEDRIVKQAIAPLTRSTAPLDLPMDLPGHDPQVAWITRGAGAPSEQEITVNPRAASARLRAARRIRKAAA